MDGRKDVKNNRIYTGIDYPYLSCCCCCILLSEYTLVGNGYESNKKTWCSGKADNASKRKYN